MMHPDRKPGVKLVTDPPARVERLSVRIAESDADVLIAGPESDYRRHGEAMRRLREGLKLARENKGRMNL